MQYLISGLIVSSDIPLPEVAALPNAGTGPDVRIRRGHVPWQLADTTVSGPNWMVADHRFLVHIPTICRFLVSGGSDIIVDADSAEADVIPFLLGTAFGALLHQRDALVFHASAVSHAGRAIALCGPSGVGKSTLSAALCQAGCGFISDDVSAIRFDSDGVPEVLPDSRQHRLWAGAIEQLSLLDRQGDAVRENLEKYHVAPTSAVEAMPLSMIIVVSVAPFVGRTAMIEPLTLANAGALLRRNVYRPNFASRMGRDRALFGQIAKVLESVRVYRLVRPIEAERLNDVVALLRDHVFGPS